MKNEQASDSPGYLYLIEAVSFHGFFPGIYLKRCKIGLSSNPEQRLQRLNSNQMPCNLKVLQVIQVKSMEAAEKKMHQLFKRHNVKLCKSREWFDLTLWRLWLVQEKFKYFETRSPYALTKMKARRYSLFRQIIGFLIFTVISGLVLHACWDAYAVLSSYFQQMPVER